MKGAAQEPAGAAELEKGVDKGVAEPVGEVIANPGSSGRGRRRSACIGCGRGWRYGRRERRKRSSHARKRTGVGATGSAAEEESWVHWWSLRG